MQSPAQPAARREIPHPSDLVTLECRHGVLSFLAKDDPIGRSLQEYGEWAEQEVRLLLRLVREGDTVLDVGANVGTHTLPLARRVGPRGRVLAFEPQAPIFELLRGNMTRNHLSMVEARREGVAGARGEMRVPAVDYRSRLNAGAVGLVAVNEGMTAARSELVPVTSVDALHLPRCELLKLDVEGMELEALRGARETILRCAPIVYAECNRIETGWEVVRAARELELRVLLHRSPAFNPENFFENAVNTFGAAHETSLLLVPRSRSRDVDAIAAAFDLTPIASLDDLARAMLETPRWGDPELRAVSAAELARRLGEARRAEQAQADGRRRLEEQLARAASEARLNDERIGKLERQAADAERRARELAAPLVDSLDERYRGRPLARLAARVRESLRALRGRTPPRRAPSATERLVAQSGLFDAEHYRAHNADLARLGDLALVGHYVHHGGREGRNPCALFDSSYYLDSNPDVRAAGVNPLVHYVTRGAAEGRDPNPLFDTAYYASHARVASSGLNPLFHYLRFGAAAGLDPSPAFGTAAYLEEHPEASAAGTSPLAHRLAALMRTDPGPPRPPPGLVAFRRAPRPVPPTREEWAELVAQRQAEGPREAPVVDVLIPVYLGFAETLRCLHSVLSARCRTPHAVVVVNDATPDPELLRELEHLSEAGLVELVHNERNAGFVATCNRGMGLHPERDVVLLNSDTEVYGDWLDRLRAAARSAPRVASVTPLSNAATICSYPFFPHESDLALEVEFAEIDRLAAAVNAGERVALPTAVGFCMYVRRASLDEVGFFDVERFGRGYGEENDFCLRASKRGWTHLLASDTFVRHVGGVSFGAEKKARIEEGLAKIHERFPRYGATVERFVTADPPREARRRLDLARLEKRAKATAMLFVTHNWGGGIERHVQDMRRRLEAEGVAVFFLRPHLEHERRAVLSHPDAAPTPNVGPFPIDGDVTPLVESLRRLRVTHVHVHSLVGFDQPRAADFVRRVSDALAAPYDFTVHDYASFCPRINLIDRSGLYCGEPALGSCKRCLRASGSPFGKVRLGPWMGAYGRLLGGARAVFAPGKDAAERISAHFPGLAVRVRGHLEPPLERAAPASRRREAGDPLRVAIIGAIGPHKGFEIVRACARDAAERRLPLSFHVVGYSCDDAALAEWGNVSISGAYEDGALAALLAEARCHCAFFPSVWPETWSYTLSAAIEAGLHPVAFDLGVAAERLRALGWGTLLPLTPDPVAVNEALLAVDSGAPLDPERLGSAFGSCESVVRDYYGLTPAAR